ncbi:gustatory receptor for sugar taste 43a-like [Adelges cooleyi]|uniref:gustatory receptor for sugar taste 43a-like n=1 Tax=Adelges cooleyi TaxID=133065 RepID=UPI0021802115|nr:gustatory receptor for sugar taste 43a-like [Adelges cooleyi]
MLYFAWILSQLCYLFLMVMPPSLAALKAEKTPVIICEYLDIDLTPDDTKQLEIFVLQLHKFKISFSICGVMRLQTSFITRVIGTTITYLMVLVQFQNPS